MKAFNGLRKCSTLSDGATLVASSEALAVDVSSSDDALTVVLEDGRVLSAPLVWFPRLARATPKQRDEWEFIGGGIGIHWEAVDADYCAV
jgi:hypothetical protein